VQKDSFTNFVVHYEMTTAVRVTIFMFLAFSCTVARNVTEVEVDEFDVGVVLDLGTTVGKVALTSITMAIEDFYAVHSNYTTRLALHIKDSMGDDVQAACAGKCR
jgi:glutamate receptor, ionotropic, plant